MATIDIAIDMGSSNTVIYKRGSGIVLREPSVVCLQMGAKHAKIKEIGSKAKKMQGRTGENITVVYPICEGVVKNVDLAIVMLKYFISKVIPQGAFRPKIRAILCVPCGLSSEELNDYDKVMYGAGVGRLHIIPSILAAAIGDELKTSQARGSIVVNIGGGTTEVAVISLNSIVSGCSVAVGGRLMDTALIEYIQKVYNIRISELSAEKIKCDIASLYENDKSNIEFSGADVSSNRPVSDVIGAKDVRNAVISFYDDVIKTIEAVINTCKPDIIADITQVGAVVSGGGANITGLENYFRKILNMPIIVSDQAENSVILGAGKLLNDEYLLNKILEEN